MDQSKAQHIRAAVLKLGRGARPREVIRFLAEREIAVTPQQVANERAKLARRAASDKVRDFPVSTLRRVHALVAELGSTAIIRRALDIIDEVRDHP